VSFGEGVAIMLQHIDYWRNAPLWDAASIQAATEAWFHSLSAEKA
jgi:UDP-glucose 4-epimerase